jgi:hypothetical protein
VGRTVKAEVEMLETVGGNQTLLQEIVNALSGIVVTGCENCR